LPEDIIKKVRLYLNDKDGLYFSDKHIEEVYQDLPSEYIKNFSNRRIIFIICAIFCNIMGNVEQSKQFMNLI
jgi:hypothetical protein